MSNQTGSDKKVVVIGAGPAGLTAAYRLCKSGVPSIVLEKDPEMVGGISQTARYKGYHFDIGGHRFFTKVKVVDDMWHEVMDPGDFLERGRMSRIYYNKKFFHYPLRAANALLGLGVLNSILVGLSYIKARVLPIRDERSFEDWVSNRFGKRLYSIFFKTYTEKVWGIRCDQLSAEWAAQRIKGLSLLSALKNALLPQKNVSKKNVIKTLIDAFHYPKRGPGMMWETVAEKIQKQGSELRMDAGVEKIFWSGNRIDAVGIAKNGSIERVEGTEFVSTMPVRELIQASDPPPPQEVIDAAEKLSYRDFLTVALIVDKADLFPDNWIYIHDDDVQVGRVQNFKNWSPYMVPDPSKSCVGLEYFCFEGDGLWTKADADLIAQGTDEMHRLGLIDRKDVIDGAVVRMPKAYPVYDEVYKEAMETVREWVDAKENLYLVGRNGMHKYNNQDHSMLTAMLAVENINGANHDIWQVNDEQEYHEEVTKDEASRDERAEELAALARTQPQVPMADPSLKPGEVAVLRMFSRIDKLSFGAAVGIVLGALTFLATAILVLKGGDQVGTNLQLLGQYFVGFNVSWAGALIGSIYGFVWGFLLGWLIAYVRNLGVGIYLQFVRRRAEAEYLKDFLTHI